MTINVLELEQNTPEWLQARKGKASGSNADILLKDGLEEALKMNDKSFRGNYFTQRGHILEVEAIKIYEEIYSVIVARPGLVVNSLYKNAVCSPDGIANNILIEVKAFNHDKHLDIIDVYNKYKAIPFKIMAQVQFNMLITGLKTAHLVMYNPEVADHNLAFQVITIKADRSIHRNMINLLKGKVHGKKIS